MPGSDVVGHDMYVSKKSGSWKWRKYKCKLCNHVTTFNMLECHLSRKHTNEWRATTNLESVYSYFEELPIEE